jgi:hypothetical protein
MAICQRISHPHNREKQTAEIHPKPVCMDSSETTATIPAAMTNNGRLTQKRENIPMGFNLKGGEERGERDFLNQKSAIVIQQSSMDSWSVALC